MSKTYEDREVTYKTPVLVSAKCDECGAALEIVPEGWRDQPMTKNTMGVEVGGGYHSFIDGGADLEFCPSLLKAIQDERGF